MNGAEAIVRTLIDSGVEVCFANPGTSEMQLVAAIGAVEGLRPVLGLFEGVVTGAADGYARIAGKPAATLLHLGPGMGNGISNIHNAKRARTPMVNVIGDHALPHRALDAPLTSDIEGAARPWHGWVRTVQTVAQAGSDTAAAVAASQTGAPAPVALIVPADIAWSEGAAAAARVPVPGRATPDAARVEAIAKRLSAAGANGMLLLGGAGVGERGLRAAGCIAAKTGCRLFTETFNARSARGAGVVAVPRLPYFGEQAADAMGGISDLVLVEAKAPVAFFAYPGKPSRFTPAGAAVHTLAELDEDGAAALEALAAALDAPSAPAGVAGRVTPDAPRAGALDPQAIAMTVARHLPEGAIVADESVTAGLFLQHVMPMAARHDAMDLTGGSIGYGLPAATGAAIAAPGRKVVCLEGDGSALYTIQALWTQARENLDVVTVIFANRSYAILNFEMMRVGAQNPGPRALSMLKIDQPTLDFVSLARGQGVEAARAETAEAFEDLFAAAMRRKGAFLIEAAL